MTRTIAEQFADAKSRIENLTNDQMEVEMAKGATIVDIREQVELDRTGMILGAVHIPRGLLEWAADETSSYYNPAFGKADRIILHCAGGGRSALAVDTLQSMGYSDVAHLEPGIDGWIAAGKPVDKPQ